MGSKVGAMGGEVSMKGPVYDHSKNNKFIIATHALILRYGSLKNYSYYRTGRTLVPVSERPFRITVAFTRWFLEGR